MDLKDISQEEFERIEAYLNHSLSEEEAVAFEKRLENDKAFSEKVENIKIIMAGIETQALKEQLDTFHNQFTSEENNTTHFESKLRYLRWRRIAVAAIVIIAAGSLWFFNMNSNERLYTEFYSPDPGLPTTMSSNDNYEFYNAMVSYKRGQYEDALKTWNNQLETKVDNDTLNYFVGSALMANQQENKAIPYLQKVATQDNSVFKNDAQYYLGLAYLKNNQKEKAVESFQESDIPNAKDLLEKLE